MEIRAGTGGDEAALFARDLFEMYKHHAENKGWKMRDPGSQPDRAGRLQQDHAGLRRRRASIASCNTKAAAHRVQRVPETETKGRMHTSAATVAVLPEPEDVEIDLKPDDYRLDKFCASGPGGQHVNKTESAVRLTHYETGIVVSMPGRKEPAQKPGQGPPRFSNRDSTSTISKKSRQKRAAERKTMVGCGDRSDKIRTYNFPDNRLTDHRIGFTIYKLDQIIRGNFQPVTDALIEYDRNQLRDQMGVLE